jgi:hypothetical protein
VEGCNGTVFQVVVMIKDVVAQEVTCTLKCRSK